MNYIKHILAFIFIIFLSTKSYSQEKLNEYQYVLIQSYHGKEKLDKRRESFNIGTILKNHLNNKNFVAFVQDVDQIPASINPCEILKVRINDSGFTVTKITIDFLDCQGKTIYTSKKGVSRIKDFKPSYFDAFQKTLADPNIEEHKYTKE